MPLIPTRTYFDQDGESLQYPELGVWFFFNVLDYVRTIGLDPPFSGEIYGLKLGDTASMLVAKLGPPDDQMEYGLDIGVAYKKTENRPFVRYDVDPDGIIVRIFL